MRGVLKEGEMKTNLNEKLRSRCQKMRKLWGK